MNQEMTTGDRMKQVLMLWVAGLQLCAAFGIDSTVFVAEQILSRPTDHSVTISIVAKKSVQLFFEYGTAPGTYPNQTEVKTSSAGVPVRFAVIGLLPNNRYYYRLRYKDLNASILQAGDERTFHTQRSKGSSFKFTVEADPHPYDKKGNHSLLAIALKNQLADSADFLLDLGDTFGDDHNPTTITSEELRQLHVDWLSYFGLVNHSSPLFLCLGNHEGESGYYLQQAPPDNLGVNATLWRKYYFANPEPDGFYSGNAVEEQFGMGLPQNYYAWEWGDALFVVLDAYRGYTANAKPRGWDWTFGKEQYDWFKKTLEQSSAKFKFVFTHHTLGETRGGVVTAPFYEWGGYEGDKRTWGFATNRPGWELPIHQLMVKNGVQLFVQGHDHLFAVEELDGIIYQEVPMPSDSTYLIGMNDNGDAYTGLKLAGSGHVRVSVSPDSIRVEYVQAWLPADENATRHNRTVAYSYSISPKVTDVSAEPPIPADIMLEQNYPNPFNPATSIRYSLSHTGMTSLRVYDLLGREVAELVNGIMEKGTHVTTWDASRLTSGLYLIQLRAGNQTMIRKAMLLR